MLDFPGLGSSGWSTKSAPKSFPDVPGTG